MSQLTDWLMFVFLLVLGVGSIVRVRQLWRGPIFPDTPGLAALERAMPAFLPGLWAMVVGFVAILFGTPTPVRDPVLELSGTLFLLAFFGSFALGLSAALFNWPKAIVPPHRRDDPGLLSSRPFRGTRSRPAAAAPMPELPRWWFGVAAAVVLVMLAGVLFLRWPPSLLAALALPLVLLGGFRARRR